MYDHIHAKIALVLFLSKTLEHPVFAFHVLELHLNARATCGTRRTLSKPSRRTLRTQPMTTR